MSQPQLIAVDIGNSATKLGWFGAATAGLPSPADVLAFPTGQPPPDGWENELPPPPRAWHISSVNRDGTRRVLEWIARHRPQDESRVLTHTDLPIAVDVEFPERVGLDRLAAAVAANVLREPCRAAIVVGAVSAITVNLIRADGAFAGGAILPGFKMQADALYGGADLLPLALLAPDDEPPPLVGANTEAAIRSGLFWGAVGAVREIAGRMAALLDPPPQVFVTGGDLRQLTEHLGDEAQFIPNLVLSGIAIAAWRKQPAAAGG